MNSVQSGGGSNLIEAVQQKGCSLYHEPGGEEAIRRIVEIFYDIVEQDQEAAELHLLHRRGHGIAHSREEQFNYLSGFFGGPSYYVQKHGHSRLKEIHEHVEIGPELRDLWLKSNAHVVLGESLTTRCKLRFTQGRVND